MADAWGGSWGTSWLSTWQTRVIEEPAPAPQPQPSGGGGGYFVRLDDEDTRAERARRKKRQQPPPRQPLRLELDISEPDAVVIRVRGKASFGATRAFNPVASRPVVAAAGAAETHYEGAVTIANGVRLKLGGGRVAFAQTTAIIALRQDMQKEMKRGRSNLEALWMLLGGGQR